MNTFRKFKKSTLYVWIVVLSVSFLISQNLTLHAHPIGHDHHIHHDHNPDQFSVTDHSHVSIAHLSLDDSHADHHDQVIYESDASPDCLLIKILDNIPLTALMSLLFVLLLFGICRNTYFRQWDKHNIRTRWSHFTPLLRAPPV